MVARLIVILALAGSSAAWADVSIVPNGPGWAMSCIQRLRARLDRLPGRSGAVAVVGGRTVVTATRVEYRLGDPRGEELVAALMRADGNESQPWERDDQWNYPIEPRLVWRERRVVPDYEAQVAVFRREGSAGPPATRRTAFVAAARQGLDECIALASRWRAPAGAIRWTRMGEGRVDTFAVEPNGHASVGRNTEGGATGSMASASAEDVDPVIALLGRTDFCNLRASRDTAGGEIIESIELDVESPADDRMRCTITLPQHMWQAQPRARACRDAVLALRDRFFPGRTSGREDKPEDLPPRP
jgi:hypothetical protein